MSNRTRFPKLGNEGDTECEILNGLLSTFNNGKIEGGGEWSHDNEVFQISSLNQPIFHLIMRILLGVVVFYMKIGGLSLGRKTIPNKEDYNIFFFN